MSDKYKLNLRDKAGWLLHSAVHAYCAFNGWKHNYSQKKPSPKQALRPKHHTGLYGYPRQTGLQHNHTL